MGYLQDNTCWITTEIYSDQCPPAVCIYGCNKHKARIRINQVRLPILLVVSWTGKIGISLSPFAPKNLVSWDGFGSPVPRQPAHLTIRAESGAYLRNSSRFLWWRPFNYATSLSGREIAYRWLSLPRVRRHRASKPQGSSKRALSWQVTMDYLACASLYHAYCWYEVHLWKVSTCQLTITLWGYGNKAWVRP